MSRVGEDLLRRTDLDDPAEVHDRHPVAEELRRRQVVGDVDVGEIEVPLEVEHQLEDLGAHTHVEHRDRLVGDQEFWSQDDGAGHHGSCFCPPDRSPGYLSRKRSTGRGRPARGLRDSARRSSLSLAARGSAAGGRPQCSMSIDGLRDALGSWNTICRCAAAAGLAFGQGTQLRRGSRASGGGPGRAGRDPASSSRCRTPPRGRGPRPLRSWNVTPSTALTTRRRRRRGGSASCRRARSGPRGHGRRGSSRRRRWPGQWAASGFVGNADLLPHQGLRTAAGTNSSGPCNQHATATGDRDLLGSRSRHTCMASGQRGWNRQPGGGSTQSGGAPAM